jgi:hypothetical protein
MDSAGGQNWFDGQFVAPDRLANASTSQSDIELQRMLLEHDVQAIAKQDLHAAEWNSGFHSGMNAHSGAVFDYSHSQNALEALQQPRAGKGKIGKNRFVERISLFGKSEAEANDQRTTVMIKNIPNNYTRDMLLELLDSIGFALRYNFVYLPMDFHRRANLGYAFVNLVSPRDAQTIMQYLHGFADWSVCASDKVCEMTWGYPLQGLEAHVQRFRNSPVMHEHVPENFKPLLFYQGVPTPLPAPTKRLRMPRMRHCGEWEGQ